MQSKINRLRQLSDQMFSEQSAVSKVKNSPEYEQIGNQIQTLLDKQSALLPEESSSSEYASLKMEIVNQMKAESNYDLEGVIPKFTEKKEVNQNKVMEVIGGDFGLYQELSTITQKTLKDFATTQAGLKKPLMNCIEVVSRELKDISLITI